MDRRTIANFMDVLGRPLGSYPVGLASISLFLADICVLEYILNLWGVEGVVL